MNFTMDCVVEDINDEFYDEKGNKTDEDDLDLRDEEASSSLYLKFMSPQKEES